jgi:N-acyl homoserine lactone hydrolase
MAITITPLHMGSIIRDKSGFTYMANVGVKIELPIIAWLVETAETKIMVDTGTNGPEETAEYHKPLIRKREQELPYLLKKLGVDPGEISTVILTHLHWDHCYNNRLFPRAQFIVQRAEIRYAIAPLPPHVHAFDLPPIVETKYTVISGDKKIIDGVTILLTPGHTPGSQSVLLESEKRRILIGGDTMPLYENWNDNPVPVPSGIFVNLEDYYATFDRIASLNLDLFLPGHDIRVFDKEKYVV